MTWITLTNVFSNPANAALTNTANGVLSQGLDTIITFLFSAIMLVFNFITSPNVLTVLIAFGVIYWTFKIVKGKILKGKM